MKNILLLSITAIGFFAVSSQTNSDSLGVCPKVAFELVGQNDKGLDVYMNTLMKESGKDLDFINAQLTSQNVYCRYGGGVSAVLTIPAGYDAGSCTFNNATPREKKCHESRKKCVITCNK